MNPLSGYVEIEMGDKTLPFKFGSNAFGLFCASRGLEFWQIAESGVFGKMVDGKLVAPDFTAMRDLCFYAHQAAMRSKGEKELVNQFAFGDLLDETVGALEQLQGAIFTAKMLGFTVSELNEKAEESKKILLGESGLYTVAVR